MSTLNDAICTSPPTGAGASVRVCPNETGGSPAPVSWPVGCNYHSELRKSSTIGAVNVAGAPTRISRSWLSHGSAAFLPDVR